MQQVCELPSEAGTEDIDEGLNLQAHNELNAGRNLGNDAGDDFNAKVDEDVEHSADELGEEAAKIAEAGQNLYLDVDRDDSNDGSTGVEDALKRQKRQMRPLGSESPCLPGSIGRRD